MRLLGRNKAHGAEVAKRGLHGVCREEAGSRPWHPAPLGATALQQWREGTAPPPAEVTATSQLEQLQPAPEL